MSLDGATREQKQESDIVRTDRPLSMSLVLPTHSGTGDVQQSPGDVPESDTSVIEGDNERSLEDAEDTPRERAVSRCSSLRSMRSNNSYASTAASGASGISLSGLSVSSSASRTRGGKGKIVPLYNLAVSGSDVFLRYDAECDRTSRSIML